ncbi:MAG: glutathione S-transferase [Gammaproteobacteria bacterium]|jgi:glutathione S-transferase
MAVLYQFLGSHFCEKARWALDCKGVPYTAVNLIPGAHISKTKKIARKSSLPILVDDGNVIQGSAEIITYLDKQHLHPALTPMNPEDRSIAFEWERYLDRNLGVPFRLCFYFEALDNRAMATDFLLRGTPWWGRPLYAVTYPGLRRSMRKHMGINADSDKAAYAQLEATFGKLDERLSKHKFLAGSQFSRADLTAAALLFHRWSSDWPAPTEVGNFMDEHKQRPFYRWAGDIYAHYRKGSNA